MKNYNFNLHLFLIVAAQISLILTGLSLLVLGKVNFESFKDLLLHYELILLPLTLLYFYFENLGWRQKYWKWSRRFLKFPPDIRGRWEGDLTRSSPDKYESKFVIEIEQTMTNLQIYSYTASNSESSSILDDIACDIKHENNYQLCFLWEGNATNLPNQTEESGKFIGYTILKIRETKEVRELEGNYFTDRKPEQTQGKLRLTWVSHDLKRKF
jgi:hypothetical protein